MSLCKMQGQRSLIFTVYGIISRHADVNILFRLCQPSIKYTYISNLVLKRAIPNCNNFECLIHIKLA